MSGAMFRYSVAQAKPFQQGADGAVHGIIGRWRRRPSVLRDLRSQSERVEQFGQTFAEFPKDKLQARIRELATLLRRKNGRESEVLLSVVAALREAARRELGLQAYPEQIIGALALHGGYIAEMATGEGKTLTAALAGALAGFSGQPCHVITVNDYLVTRDAKWVTPFFRFCGLEVGRVTADMPPEERRAAYSADVTYVTSKEALADYLRDRLRLGSLANPTRQLVRELLRPGLNFQGNVLLRGLHTAIIDEADSILIDEAVTPLIISAERENEAWAQGAEKARDLAEELETGRHYRVDQRHREIHFTEAGDAALHLLGSDQGGLWKNETRRRELVRQAIVAREFFHRGKQYLVQDGKIIIVDEFTGRPMEQRSWTQGLHQAIETKERLALTRPKETIARMSFQGFFRSYHRLSGMTGTASEAAQEVWRVYGLPVLRIPTHKPCRRRLLPDRVFAKAEEKWNAVAQEIAAIHRTGRPILIGTRSVAASEHLASILRKDGLSFALLNATRLKEEADIIELAGQSGRITIATNMAGRGTDIKLGEGVAECGGLHVIATERHEAARIDRQLFGRCARQGDPGSAQAFLSWEDELPGKYLTPAERRLFSRAGLTRQAFARAQHKAQTQAFQQRKSVLRNDNWLNEALSFGA